MGRRVILNRPLHIYETGTAVDTSKGTSIGLIAYDARFSALSADIAKSEAIIEQENLFSAAIDTAAVSISANGNTAQSTGKDPAARQVQDLLKVKS